MCVYTCEWYNSLQTDTNSTLKEWLVLQFREMHSKMDWIIDSHRLLQKEIESVSDSQHQLKAMIVKKKQKKVKKLAFACMNVYIIDRL